MYCREAKPGGIIFPSQNNNIIYIRLAYCKPCGNWKFLAVRRVSFDDPSRGDIRPFPVT
jgi:hypothetical protein